MSRPVREGIGYFSKDTDFYEDDKVRILRAQFGAKGMYLLDYLLCKIYKSGYFLRWDSNGCFLVSDGAGCGCSVEFTEEFVKGCCKCSFFDEGVLTAFGVLTSHGIQQRYLRAKEKQSEVKFFRELWLLNINDKNDVPPSMREKIMFHGLIPTETPNLPPKTPLIPEETHLIPPETHETKEKESKRKGTNVPKGADAPGVIVPDGIREAWEGFVVMRTKIKKPMTDRAKTMLLNKLEELAPGNLVTQAKILDQSTMNSWQGIFPLREDKAKDILPAYDKQLDFFAGMGDDNGI